VESAELKFPKLLLLDSEFLVFNCIVPTSKHAELVTLYIDQLTFASGPSLMEHLFVTIPSTSNVPGPRRPFRMRKSRLHSRRILVEAVDLIFDLS
jgi:hypothetical protein